MSKLKNNIRWGISKIIYTLFPRSLRLAIIKTLLLAEESAPPRQSVSWLLGIYDYVAMSIDSQSIRWGNGVHIKHNIMDGIHSFFYSRIPEGATVLDLGCGIGTVANAIATHSNATVLGIDLDQKSIEFAKNTYRQKNLQFILGDIFKDIPNIASVDVIVLSSVLEHLDGRVSFLRELIKKFHPQKILIRVPTLERTHYVALKIELGLSPYLDRTHVLEYSADIFKKEMNDANLKIDFLDTRWGDLWAECTPLV